MPLKKWRNPTHLIDDFKVDAKGWRGVQAADLPLTRATHTNFLGEEFNIKNQPLRQG